MRNLYKRLLIDITINGRFIRVLFVCMKGLRRMTQEKKKCLKCLSRKEPNANFYKSYSSWHGDGLLPICKKCLKDYIKDKEDNLNVAKEIMRILDKPFKLDIWNQALKSKKETLGEYLRIINLNSGTETYDDGDSNSKVFTERSNIENNANEYKDEFIVEDKVYSKKWLGYYIPSEIDYLEEYLNGLDRDFRVVTMSHRDYAMKIAKASLHMDKCFQEMQDGINGADKKYREAKDIFDTLSKSAKFSESQRGITDVGMGSISQIVEMVESETWVYEHKNDLDKDMYDKLIDDFQHIYKSL